MPQQRILEDLIFDLAYCPAGTLVSPPIVGLRSHVLYRDHLTLEPDTDAEQPQEVGELLEFLEFLDRDPRTLIWLGDDKKLTSFHLSGSKFVLETS